MSPTKTHQRRKGWPQPIRKIGEKQTREQPGGKPLNVNLPPPKTDICWRCGVPWVQHARDPLDGYNQILPLRDNASPPTPKALTFRTTEGHNRCLRAPCIFLSRLLAGLSKTTLIRQVNEDISFFSLLFCTTRFLLYPVIYLDNSVQRLAYS